MPMVRSLRASTLRSSRDLNGVRAALKQMFPNGDIRIEGVGDGVVLSGNVSSPTESQQAFDLATRLVGEATKVANAITVSARDQVMLESHRRRRSSGTSSNSSELTSTAHCPAGREISASPWSTHSRPLRRVSASQPWTQERFIHSGNAACHGTRRCHPHARRAHAHRDFRRKAPASSQAESFRFPAATPAATQATVGPIQVLGTCQISIQFKKFGVGLNFTPVVLSEGRISLKVMTEVSEISNENAITLQPTPNSPTLTIPSIRTRRADTTVEIPSGGLAGDGRYAAGTDTAGHQRLPGLMQLPVLGALFKSRDYLNRQTELAVIITPYVVRAVARKDLSRPDDGCASSKRRRSCPSWPPQPHLWPPEPQLSLRATASYRGKYGFIVD